MRFARYEVQGTTGYGEVEGQTVREISAPPFEKYQVTGRSLHLSEVRLLAPLMPGKIVAIGLNYKSHLGDREPPKVPEPFLKTPSSVIGPGDTILLPRDTVKVQEEAELVVVIGRRCKGATRDDALSYVLGYTCGNDVSARDWQGGDLQWWRAKSSDTFCPLGPFIETDVNPANVGLRARVNGRVEQDGNTSDLLHDVPTIIEFVSRVMALDPGDVIMTGTPGQPGDLHPGDSVDVEIDGIGTLTNPVGAV